MYFSFLLLSFSPPFYPLLAIPLLPKRERKRRTKKEAERGLQRGKETRSGTAVTKKSPNDFHARNPSWEKKNRRRKDGRRGRGRGGEGEYPNGKDVKEENGGQSG